MPNNPDIYLYKPNTVITLHTYITYIQKFILARLPQQLRADFHEGREFRKNILYTAKR